LPINSSLQHTQKRRAILQKKKPQKTLNHTNPKNHTSFSSLLGQPLTAPVKKKFRENRCGQKPPFHCSQRPAAPAPLSLSNPIPTNLPLSAVPSP